MGRRSPGWRRKEVAGATAPLPVPTARVGESRRRNATDRKRGRPAAHEKLAHATTGIDCHAADGTRTDFVRGHRDNDLTCGPYLEMQVRCLSQVSATLVKLVTSSYQAPESVGPEGLVRDELVMARDPEPGRATPR